MIYCPGWIIFQKDILILILWEKHFSSIIWLDLNFSSNLASQIQFLSLFEYFYRINQYLLLLYIYIFLYNATNYGKKSRRSKITLNWNLIDSRWVFDKDRDGQYRACLVAQGYLQIPGVHFTNNLSSVVTDVTLNAIILMWLMNNCSYQTRDVETDFFYASP